jgi:hypothetical protein
MSIFGQHHRCGCCVDVVSRFYCPPSTALRQNFELERVDEMASRNYFIYHEQDLQLMDMSAYDFHLGVDSLHTLSELAA